MEVLSNAVQSAWNGILGLTEKLVIPDWGGLVALIPVGLAAVVVLFYVREIRRWATAGPSRRGGGPRPPLPPEGVHAPGPSFAPIFAAVGTFLLFFGLILASRAQTWGIAALVLGVISLVLTLLYWLREGMRDYEAHAEPTRVALPALTAGGPPPGVHIPAPSFRPILIALSACVLFFGLVFGTAILVAGLILLVASLLGWLRDARTEYVATMVADRTGHLEPGAAPRFPTRSLVAGSLIVLLAAAINAGIIPPRSETAGGGGGATASSTPSGAPAASPGASAAASQIPKADVTITARGIAFVEKSVEAKAGAGFTLAFDNQDSGTPHNVDIKDSSGASVFRGEITTGVKAIVYDVPALAAGTYQFVCDVHANMSGTLTVK